MWDNSNLGILDMGQSRETQHFGGPLKKDTPKLVLLYTDGHGTPKSHPFVEETPLGKRTRLLGSLVLWFNVNL